jgi:hypothetical protein
MAILRQHEAKQVPEYRCEKCGFLALRNRLTGTLDEAPQEYRWRAEVPTFRRAGVSSGQFISDFYDYPYIGVPICLVRAYPLHNEFTNQDQASKGEIFRMLEKDRNDCAKRRLFTDWQQGFTPKEHREMLDRRWERKWRIIELIVLGVIAVLVAGGFTILGALIERGSIP